MAEARGKTYDEVKQSDVLLGRGKSIHCHPGNIEYRKVVKGKSRQYQTVEDGAEKDAIAHAVIDNVFQKGGKFLRPTIDEERWVECPASIVRTKVKQALRDMVKDRKPVSQKSNVSRRERTVSTRQSIARFSAGRADSSKAEAKNPEPSRYTAEPSAFASDRQAVTGQGLSTGTTGSNLPHSLEALIASRSHIAGQHIPSLLLLGAQPPPFLGAGLGVPNLLRQSPLFAPNLMSPAMNDLGQLSAAQQYLSLLRQTQSLQQQPVASLGPLTDSDAALADFIQRLHGRQRR